MHLDVRVSKSDVRFWTPHVLVNDPSLTSVLHTCTMHHHHHHLYRLHTFSLSPSPPVAGPAGWARGKARRTGSSSSLPSLPPCRGPWHPVRLLRGQRGVKSRWGARLRSDYLTQTVWLCDAIQDDSAADDQQHPSVPPVLPSCVWHLCAIPPLSRLFLPTSLPLSLTHTHSLTHKHTLSAYVSLSHSDYTDLSCVTVIRERERERERARARAREGSEGGESAPKL